MVRQPSPEAQRQLQELEALFSRVFGTPEGQKVLEHLMGKFHDRQIYMPGGPEGQRETDRRAAHKEVVAYMLRLIGQIGG